jgi:alkylation response protein AidB-like acyl-CoA dehydrogenase
VQRFIQNDYSFEHRQKLIASDEGFSRDNWAAFAELGWLALPFSEADGGFGGTAVETMILMEEFGKGLIVEPYLSSIVMSASLIARAGSDEQKESWLQPVLQGEKLAALAFIEPQARFNLADVKTVAAADAGGFCISGFKGVVLGGPSADFLIVPARTNGSQTDEKGISLFLVDARSDGVHRRNYPTIDGFRASEVTFKDVEVTSDAVLGEIDGGLGSLQFAIDQAIMAVGAEATGAMEVLYKSTVEYCKTREQFGQPIGKFQVLQHRMVDMFIEHEQTKSLAYMAAMRLAENYDDESRKSLAALKVQAGRGGKFVGQNAVQLHGGMGMTNELNIGHYFKRLTAIDTLFGNADFHLKRYASF